MIRCVSVGDVGAGGNSMVRTISDWFKNVIRDSRMKMSLT